MKRFGRQILALALSVVMVLALAPPSGGQAVLSGVYLTAVNDQLLELNSETMPFYSSGVLYVSSKVFEGTDLGVSYVRNSSMGLAVLYTPRTDLRFDLANQTVYDQQGVVYSGYAIEKGSYVFFPLDMVCRYFGLRWSYNETDTVPLIRVQSSSAALADSSFLDAATGQMNSYYAAYERLVQAQQDTQPQEDPPIYAAAGQKVFLVIESTNAEDTLSALEILGDTQATFLLTAGQMENADLLRGLVAGGHSVALLAAGTTEAEVESEIESARALLWQSACLWLNLVWYEGEAETGQLLEELGCTPVTAEVDRRAAGLSSASRARALLSTISRYRTDLSVFLGGDSGCLEGLGTLLEELEDAQYRICSWRVSS